jgi:hypothetical protein
MAGRKSHYDPKYCEQIVECLSRGHSIEGFAGEIGKARSTVFDWLNKHPEFKEAAEIATSAAVFFWEKQLILAATTKFEGEMSAVIFGLKNRAHREWRDVHKLEHAGSEGGPIKVTIAGVDAGLL